MGEWTQVNRQRNTPPRWMVDQELQELREEMAWMRSRLSAPSQGSKGKGKGKGQAKPKPKGASQGAPPPTTTTPASSEGPARRRPNLKPNEERATPTLIEIKCQKCQAYNWTSRELCRSCETPLARLPGISTSSTPPLQPVAKPVGITPGKSYADAAAGSPPASQSVLALDKEGLSKRQAELETVIGTLPDESPLKTELSTQLDSVKEKLKDPRQPGARLDSATAGLKKATARREKAEETLKQAQEALEQARLQETRATQELEDAKAAAAPPPPPETPPPGSVSLSSDDVAGLISFFQELAEEREAAPGVEPPSKKGRVGPYGETPSLKAAKDAAVRAKLERGQAYLGFMLNQSLKSGDGCCQAATQETPSQKGSGKGSGAAPGVSAEPPQRPSAPPCTHGGEGEGSHPTHPGGPRLCNARRSGQIASPLLRGCGGLLWLCSLFCLVAQMWVDISFFAACQTEPAPTTWSSCPATKTEFEVPSQLAAAACQYACSTYCLAFVRGSVSADAPCGSPLPGRWAPENESRQVSSTCPFPTHLPGSMITKEHMGTVGVMLYMPHTQLRYQAQARLCPAPCYGRTPGVSARTLKCLSACQSQTQAPRYGRTPGVSAHDCECLSACQGQAEHDLMCVVKLPGSLHLQPLCSHIGTSGGYGHNNPLSESPGGLSGNPPPPALPVCHLGLPGSAGMADSRMASPAAAPGRLTICSVGMRHVEKNHRTGTQILPGSISGFYHREQCQAARHVLERCFRARYIEIVDLRPLKDARSYPDLRDHIGWHPTNCLINMHDRSLRDIAARIVEALRELANRARGERGTPGDCLLLLGCNQGRHRSPMIRYLLTRWMEESHGMTVDSSDVDNVHWRRHGECTLARQCVHCDVRNHDATREACVAWLRSRGLSGGVSLGRGDSRPPPGGRSVTPGPRHRQQGKGASQGSPPHLTHVSRWTRAQQAQGKGKGAARPVTLQHAPSQGPPAASVAPDVRHAGAAVDVIEVDPAPGVMDRAASVIDVDALPATVDAGVSAASITHCLNLLRTALLNNEITEEQSSHLSRLSLSTRSQTVGLWDVGTQTADYGPVQGGTARQSPANPYTNPVSASANVSGRNKMPASVPTARQSGAAASTQTSDVVREVPVEPAARRQGSRPPSYAAAAAAAAAAATAAPQVAAARQAPRAGRSPPPPGGRGVRIPEAAVEVFNMAADDSDQGVHAAEGPDARRRGPSRSRTQRTLPY